MRLLLELRVKFWCPYFKKDSEKLERIQVKDCQEYLSGNTCLRWRKLIVRSIYFAQEEVKGQHDHGLQIEEISDREGSLVLHIKT